MLFRSKSEEIVLQLENISFDISLSNLNDYINNIDGIIKMIEIANGKNPDLLHSEFYRILEDDEILTADLDFKIQFWHDKQKELVDQLSPLINTILKEKPTENSQRESICGGQKLALFSIDVNNIINSFRKKTNMRGNDPLIKIRDKYMKGNPYYALFFASKHLDFGKRDIPENDRVKWYIEINKKMKNGQKIDADVDTLLAVHTVQALDRYHDQITELYLGSGDKDLHVVVEAAQKYSIPINIIVTSQENLSNELYSVADETIILYD